MSAESKAWGCPSGGASSGLLPRLTPESGGSEGVLAHAAAARTGLRAPPPPERDGRGALPGTDPGHGGAPRAWLVSGRLTPPRRGRRRRARGEREPGRMGASEEGADEEPAGNRALLTSGGPRPHSRVRTRLLQRPQGSAPRSPLPPLAGHHTPLGVRPTGARARGSHRRGRGVNAKAGWGGVGEGGRSPAGQAERGAPRGRGSAAVPRPPAACQSLRGKCGHVPRGRFRGRGHAGMKQADRPCAPRTVPVELAGPPSSGSLSPRRTGRGFLSRAVLPESGLSRRRRRKLLAWEAESAAAEWTSTA